MRKVRKQIQHMITKNLLVLNCIADSKAIQSFDKAVTEILSRLDVFFQIQHAAGWPFDMGKYDGLLISGSELSAAEENVWDSQIYTIIREFLAGEKPILAICYGHQMLAKAILGSQACRKAKDPEFGWRYIHCDENPIFSGLENPVFFNSHFDEVCQLSEEFQVLASSENCEVQAFQFAGKPVWGLQFHPEMNYHMGEESFSTFFNENPQWLPWFQTEKFSPERIQQNQLIFRNFINFL